MGQFHTISYKFIAAAALTASKTLVYRMTPQRDGGESLSENVERQSVSGSTSAGIMPTDALGRFFETDLKLGKTENANDIVMTDVVCSVSKTKNIIKTQLSGLSGTIKEYINEGDYEIDIAVGLVAVNEQGQIIDEYPADGVRELRELLDHNDVLYVDSRFLQLFDITRLVVTGYSIEQMTHSNRQLISIKAISDEDYVIKSNEY